MGWTFPWASPFPGDFNFDFNASFTEEQQREGPEYDFRRDNPALGAMKPSISNEIGVPVVVDRGTFQAELDALRLREKAQTREGDAIAAARRRTK